MSDSRDQALVDLVDARAQMLMDLADDDLEHAGLLESDEELVEEMAVPSARKRQAPRSLMLALGAVALVSLGLVAVLSQSPAGRHRAKVGESVEMYGGAVGAALSIMTVASHGMQLAGAIGTGMEDAEKIVYDAQNISKHHDIEALENLTHSLTHMHGHELDGHNDMNDGNQCPDNEEELGGMCYQRCQDLTGGTHPIRTTAFSCCKAEPCNAFNSVFTNPMKFCRGLDVGGRQKGWGCPHAPGDCLLNEEFHLGSCYKKCLVLTDGEYPFRRSADSCCKMNDYLDCLQARNVWTDASFDIGGGDGDEVLQAEAGQVHAPIPGLAEVQTTTTLWAGVV